MQELYSELHLVDTYRGGEPANRDRTTKASVLFPNIHLIISQILEIPR